MHKLLLEWCVEFETLYCQWNPDRLHFVRQCVHSLTHLARETHRLGPLSLSAQWTMERVIGVFGSLLAQPLFRVVSGYGWIGRISRTMATLETGQDPPYEASGHREDTSQHRRETSQHRRETSQRCRETSQLIGSKCRSVAPRDARSKRPSKRRSFGGVVV